MADVVLKYSASVYQAKITKFDSLNAQLNAHLETLENLKSQIRNYWESEQAVSYASSIANAITRVRTASQTVSGLSRTYQETVDELSRGGQAVDDIVANVDKTIDRQIEVAKVVSDFIPLT